MPASNPARIKTATVIILIVTAVLYLRNFSIWPLAGLLFLVCLLASWEFYSLFWPKLTDLKRKLTGLLLAGSVIVAAAFSQDNLFLVPLILAVWGEFIIFLFSKDSNKFQFCGIMAAGIIYIPLSLQFALELSIIECVYVILLVAASDIGAYYAGTFLKGPKIWTRISPKKTWSGSFGGLLLCLIASLVYGWVFSETEPWLFALAALILNLAVQIGDFFESALKRWAGVKDSGKLLPGHGGVLDRIDSLLLALPVYVGFNALIRLFPS